MKEKEEVKISLSTFFLVLSIIAIIIMGIYIYNLNNDKTKEIKKSTELQSQVNTLNGTVSDLQGKINTISETISTNSSNSNTNTNNSSVETPKDNSTSSSATSTSKVKEKDYDDIMNKILGAWKPYKVIDSKGNDIGLSSVWGTGIIGHTNEMEFKENGILSYGIGITASSDDGAFTINGNTINYGVPTDIKGHMTWRTLTYVPEENILKEERDLIGEKVIITYIRAN